MNEQYKTFDEAMSLVEIYNEAKSKLPYHINLVDLLHANENAHSRILGELLKQKSENGQFEILQSFLQMLKEKKPTTFGNVSIEIPMITVEDERIDIWIRGKDSAGCKTYALVLENKIHWAGDQEKQLARYIDMTKMYGYQDEKIYVIYLPPSNEKDPSDQSWGNYKEIFKNRYLKITFQDDVLPWLESVVLKLNYVQSEKGNFLRSALEQYIDHLKTMFNLNSYSQIKTKIMNKEMNAYIEANLKTKDVQLEEKLVEVKKKKQELQEVQTALSVLERDYQARFLEKWNKQIVAEYGDDMRLEDEGNTYAGVNIPINDDVSFQVYLTTYDNRLYCQVENVAGNKIVPDEVKELLSSELQVWHDDGQVVKETSYEEGYSLLTRVVKKLKVSAEGSKSYRN
jgi:hypothetical protein